MLKTNYILFLGVNDLQIPALKNAKKLGLRIVGIDKNVHAPGRKYCNFFFNIDCLNIQEIYNVVTTLHGNIIGIWANNDVLIPSRIILSSLLGLKDTPIHTAFDLLNKLKFKKLTESKPYSIPYHNYKDTEDTIYDLRLPLIVKPITGGGSQDISIIRNYKDLKNLSLQQPMMVEEFKPGYELGINMFKTEGSLVEMGAVYRYFDHDGHHIPIGTVTVDHKDNVLASSYSVVADLINGIDFWGQVKADILVVDEQIYLIEISPRFHGEIDTEYVFGLYDKSLSLWFFNYLMGNEIAPITHESETKYGYVSIFLQANRIIKHEDVSKFPVGQFGDVEIISYLLHRSKGDIVKWPPKSTWDIFAFAFFKSNQFVTDKDFYRIYKELNQVINKQK
ncbi:MAG: ATP-grasp domain-containing protein [Deltaproteobacteria bacterium]|nr:ATP-grasp domain-containing protein [Deltaproteobacteria bacterium]